MAFTFRRVIVPAALQAGREGTLERRVRRFIEQVHDRLSDQVAVEAEQLQPRRIGVDDDSFLHLDDGVIRTLKNYFELTPGVVRRLQSASPTRARAETRAARAP